MTQSFFSRRQLSLLILVLPGIILLLSLLGSEPDLPDWQASADRRVYLHTVPAQTGYRIHLLLPQSAPTSATDGLQQQLLFTALRHRIQTPDELGHWLQQQGWTVQLDTLPSHVRLILHSQQPPNDPTLTTLLQRLQHPPEVDWGSLLRRVQAENYLARQQTDTWLRLSFPTTTQHSATVDPLVAYRQWLQPAHWRMTLSGAQPPALTLPLPTPDTTVPAPAPLTLAILPVPTPRVTLPITLHRWQLPVPDSVDALAMTLLAREAIHQGLSDWLAQRQTDSHSPAGFSLGWEPAGNATLIIQGAQQPSVRPWLPSQITAANLEAARQQVQQLVIDAAGQSSWLDLLARHQLPADTLQRLPQPLEHIDSTQVQHWLQQQLETDYYHTLSLPASP